MEMKRYYPSGYRRKKKRENVQRLVVYFAIAIIVGGVAILAGWAVVKMFKPGTPDQGTEQLANAQTQIDQQESEQEADLNPPPVSPLENNATADSVVQPLAPEQKPLLLEDIKDFEQSFPEIGIMLLPADEGSFPGLQEETKTEETKGETIVEDANDEPDVDTPPAGSTRPGPPVSREPGEDTSADSGSSLSRDSGNQSSSEGSKDSTDQNKKTGSSSTGASDTASKGGNSNPSGGSGGATGKYIYSVYAGSWDDKDAATRKLDELAGVGYAAQIIEGEFAGKKTFKVLVKSKLDDYDKAKEIQADLQTKGFSGAVIYKDKT
jgi:hypothetical protein